MSNQSLILAPSVAVGDYGISSEVVRLKEEALTSSALIGRVTNLAENEACVRAKKQIRSLSLAVESARKSTKEPFIEAGRKIDRAAKDVLDELDQETGRLANLEREFVLVEQRRIREEQEAQQRELDRIERERQAELARIASEQAEAERKAREAAQSAARAAAVATNEVQRKAAETARVEAQKQAEEAGRLALAQTQAVEDHAAHLAYIEGKPVEITRSAGQVVREDWVVDQIDSHVLYRARPDLVREIQWDMLAVKEVLRSGTKLPGVKAHKDVKVSTRGARSAVIDV